MYRGMIGRLWNDHLLPHTALYWPVACARTTTCMHVHGTGCHSRNALRDFARSESQHRRAASPLFVAF